MDPLRVMQQLAIKGTIKEVYILKEIFKRPMTAVHYNRFDKGPFMMTDQISNNYDLITLLFCYGCGEPVKFWYRINGSFNIKWVYHITKQVSFGCTYCHMLQDNTYNFVATSLLPN
jgi:hypothetical protein